MNLNVNQAISGQQAPTQRPANSVQEQAPAGDRDRLVQNAVNEFQAKFGEKPKEARQIKKTLDKDDFMKIMIAEMKHQDPTKPMDADKMATQMAQITSVEQMKNVGVAIEKLADKNSAQDRLAMSAMIGKSVTVDKGRFVHQKGTLSPINFDLPADAAKLKLKFLDEQGEEISSRTIESKKAGLNTYNWDGLLENGTPAKSGSYMIRVEAEDKNGSQTKIDPISKERIVGVTFEGGETNFLVGDQKSPQKVAFKNVIRIEGESLGARPQSSAAEAKAESNPAAEFLAEQMKMRSENHSVEDSTHVKNDEIQALDAVQGARVAEGFPNGLSEE